jgi:poly(3-hydroxybutyrate) depolymerase
MDADYYLETIATVFQDFKLVNGTWDVKGVDGKVERVRPQDIKGTALMTVEGELDDISGSGQTRAAQDLCSGVPASERQHLEVPGAGHYGIFSGRRWCDIVYPELVKFILNHAPKTTAKTATAAQPQATEAPKAVVQASAPSAPAKASTSQAAPVSAVKPSAQEVVKPAAKTASVATAKPVVAKPVTPAASKPAVKAPTKSTVKAVTKTSAKPATKSATAPLNKASGKGTASGSVKTTWVDPSTKA